MSSLFDQIGGEEVIDVFVDRFYQRVMQSPALSGFFEGMNMARQKKHQAYFLTYALGGLPYHPGRDLAEAHADLVAEEGLDDSHFDEVASIIHDTMVELGLEEELLAKIDVVIEKTRDQVLGR